MKIESRIRAGFLDGAGRRRFFWTSLSAACVALPAAAQKGAPSHPPFKNCAWERVSDATVGLAAWVQRCDYGFRKIDFLFKGNALAVRFSDGGEPDPLVEVFGRQPGESPEAGVLRIVRERTDAGLAARCNVVRFNFGKLPAGARRYTFAPNPAYRKELKAKQDPNEVGDPPCGDWGIAPDGIQYFEVRPLDKARKILFVRIGQDEPLFDEQTLRPM